MGGERVLGTGVYLVRLLYQGGPEIDRELWAAEATRRMGSPVELIGGTDAADRDQAIGLAFTDHVIGFSEGAIPMQVWILREADGLMDLEPDLQQTWDWPEARDVVADATLGIGVTDMLAPLAEPRVRLRVFVAALAALVTITRPVAIQWIPAQRLVKPDAFLADVDTDPYAFASTVNARFFAVDGRPGESVMDTMGMAALGLPDVQVHFTTLDPDEVAARILGTARYIFDNGDVIEDGHTVGEDRWRATHEDAIVGPDREVLDLDVGAGGPRR